MLDISQDIHSLTDFMTHTPDFIAHLQGANRAVLLTVNGRAEIAIMSAATFQRVLEAIETLDTIRAIKEGFDELTSGRVPTLEEFAVGFRMKHGIPEQNG